MEDYKLEKEANHLVDSINYLDVTVITDLIAKVEELEGQIETLEVEHSLEVDDLQDKLSDYEAKYYTSQVERLQLLEIIKNLSNELELSRQGV